MQKGVRVNNLDGSIPKSVRPLSSEFASSATNSLPNTTAKSVPPWKPATLRKRRLDMRSTKSHVFHMSTMITLRNVPTALHRELKSRAALAGMSLSDYLLRDIREVAARPTLAEMRARLERLAPLERSQAPSDAVRAERDSR